MKTCSACGADNKDTALFCRRCSHRLVSGRRCPNCGRTNPPDAQFCNKCSTSLGGAAVPAPGQTGQLTPQSLLAGRYRILRRVGQGGMGAVYQAEDLRLLGKQWAIKEMSDAALTDVERVEARQAFGREALFLAALAHPNLPKVTDSFEADGKQYLVMEFVDGQTLEELVTGVGRPLPPATVLGLGVDLCLVLDYLHRQQPPIIFRDLKPANIMIDREGTVKLIDFGIARLFTPGKSRDTTTLGTPGYAAPEQYGKGQTDARSDLYALGATLHFLLTARDPADEPFKFPPARRLNPAVPAELEAVVARAVATNADERWPSARDMRRALTQAAAGPVAVEARPAAGHHAAGASPARRPAASPVARPPARPAPQPARPPAQRAPSPTPRPPATRRPAAPAGWRDSGWFYALVVVVLGGVNVLLHESGLFGDLFPLIWFALSMLAGYLVRQIGVIALTWLSIPLYNMVVGQANELSWTVMVSLIVPIELFFLWSRYRLYTPIAMLLAGGLGVLGAWVVADLVVEDVVLIGAAVAVGSLSAYAIGRWLESVIP
ncbi:MAG: protein kinase [Candidatus Promineofilum sp.]|nr:protein kinase [Promineifilum sp.]